MKRLYGATINTFRGFAHAARTEAALRQELVLLVLALAIGLPLAPGPAWYVAMVGAVFVILAIELLNTAIEKLADHVTPDRHPAIGFVKDVGSAAVFCSLSLAGLIWVTAVSVRFHLL
jgi:diacylglycerol kinase (ATP)